MTVQIKLVPKSALKMQTVLGLSGPPGPQGDPGPQGSQGPQGKVGPANVLSIGTVSTGAPGTAANASISGSSPSQVLNLTIPQGAQGPQGVQGIQGPKGDTGATGPQGPTGATGQGFSDGNKGDITIASSGTSLTLNTGTSTDKLSFAPGWTGSVPRVLSARLSERKSVLDFIPVNLHAGIADGTNATDLATYLQAARDYIAGLAHPPKLVFPAGVYRYSVSPNWAITNAQIEAEGVVRLRYTGTGNAVIIDSGAWPTTDHANMKMGRFIVEAPSTAGHGVYVRGIHHSELEFNVRGCGSASAALRVEFAVCTVFRKFTASVNEEGWYSSAKPGTGISLDARPGNPSDTSPVSYCIFDGAIIEGVGTGADLISAIGNVLSNGTIEGCTTQGLHLRSGAQFNLIDHIDFEANNSSDVYCEGDYNEMRQLSSLGQKVDGTVNGGTVISATGANNRIVGGMFNTIGLEIGATDNIVQGALYNRFGTGSLNDASGQRNSFVGLYDIANQKFHDAKFANTAIAVGASPFTFTNTTGNTVQVGVAAGAVSTVAIIHAGVAIDAGDTKGMFVLPPGSALQVTYTSAPTMRLLKY